jgi:hypothetical protein
MIVASWYQQGDETSMCLTHHPSEAEAVEKVMPTLDLLIGNVQVVDLEEEGADRRQQPSPTAIR